MHIKVNGKQIDIGDALRSHVEEKLVHGVGKYFDNPVDAQVTFTRDAHEYRCDCSAHLSTGLVAKAQARSTEIYASFDQAVERLEKQLRRYKRRLKDHHKKRAQPADSFEAPAFVIAAENDDQEEPADLQPVIIAEMTANVPSLTVGEAVMHMEFSNEAALMFRNEGHGGLNVVYRRADGNIGWIDPKDAARGAS